MFLVGDLEGAEPAPLPIGRWNAEFDVVTFCISVFLHARRPTS